MHASIALCLMLVGGPVAPGPDPEVAFFTIPLIEDRSAANAMQEKEWMEKIKHGYKLPRVPTVVDDTRSRDDARGMGRRYGQSTDPNAPRRQQQMPYAPTDPGSMGQNGGGQGSGPMPAMPGSGLSQGQGYTQGSANGTGRFDPYQTESNFSKPVGNMGNYGGETNAPRGAYTPTASDTMSGIMGRANAGYNGVSPNPMLNTSVGGGDKPFSGYQRPNGYSPWMRLYDTPTNGGTVSPYTSAVQPAIQQQQYNQAVAERIQGVQNSIVSPRGGGTPGMEMPVNGAGLANPNGYINYGNPMGR